MADEGQKPILNPVLELRREARLAGVTGGGKGLEDIKKDRLHKQQKKLAKQLEAIMASAPTLKIFGGKFRLVARMFDDSLASTWVPASLIGPPVGCQLVVPVADGYVFETSLNRVPELIAQILAPNSIGAKVDVSRIRSIDVYGEADILKKRSLDALWDSATSYEDGRIFLAWLAPFRDATARSDLTRTIELWSNDQAFFPTWPSLRLIDDNASDRQRLAVSREPGQTSIAGALRRYRNTGHGAASIRLNSKEQLSRIVASGMVHRIDPVRPVRVTMAGVGQEPGPPPPDVSRQPIVGVIDGGLSAASYKTAEAWRAPAFVPDGKSDLVHGNKVASVVVQGHAWNNNLDLPQLFCRVGTAQAVPKVDSDFAFNPEQLISYIDSVMAAHPETRVWNLSFNEIDPVEDTSVSYLGHALSRICRARDTLAVTSGGNVAKGVTRLQPPADSEASLVVSGRGYDEDGMPGDACPVCANGPGPEGMLKPDMSWYSPLRVIGGAENRGSSFPTGLVSSLAAHTFDNLRNPTPDMVRALLLNATEREQHDAHLGWGTPYRGHEPWVCQPGSVTMLWTSKLRTKTAYYWEGIPIPEELTRDGKLFGSASLTAVLKPLTREEGEANYFITRVQVSLQYLSGGTWNSLLGSMKEDSEAEQTARTDLAKWYPVRCHRKDFSKRAGRQFDAGSSMRVFARVFSRDLYQLDLPPDADLGEHEVAFALTLNSAGGDDNLYNAMRSRLGTFVESAVIDTDVEIEGDV